MNGDVWCKQLINVFKGQFPEMNLTLGGNAADFGIGQVPRLDMFLHEEDVANLAMMSYEESIRDYSFFLQIPLSLTCTLTILLEHLPFLARCFVFIANSFCNISITCNFKTN